MRVTHALLAAVLLSPAAFFAAPAEAATIDEVKADIKYDKLMLKDDKKDLKKIRQIRAKWEKARDKGNGALEAKADTDLAAWVKSKLAEGRGEIEEAGEEAGIEPSSEPLGKPHSSGTQPLGKPSASAPRPQQSDDQEDYELEQTAQRRLKEIAESLKETQSTFSSGAASDALYAAKSAMLEELQKIAAREVGRSEKELAEDEAQLDRLKGR
jgi:hypothetical protein